MADFTVFHNVSILGPTSNGVSISKMANFTIVYLSIIYFCLIFVKWDP